MTQNLTIAIIEKYPIARLGTSIFLRENFKDARFIETDTISSFLADYSYKEPDVIILGTNPETKQNKINDFNRLRKTLKLRNLIIYDDGLDLETISYYLKSDVEGYLLKNYYLPDLILCINEVLSGKHYLCSDSIFWLVQKKFPKKR